MTNNSISILLDYLMMYKSGLLSKRYKIEDSVSRNKMMNDIDNIIRLITSKITSENQRDNSFSMELFRTCDILNLYEVDEELFYKNIRTENYEYLMNVSIHQEDSFEYFILRLSNGKIIDIEFIFNFTPLVDMLYNHYDKPYNIIISKFFKMFNIKDFYDFRELMDLEYKNIIQ